MEYYKRLVEDQEKLIEKLMHRSGLDRVLVTNIIKFTKCMAKPNTGRLDLIIVRAVLFHYFDIDHQDIIKTLFFNLLPRCGEQLISIESFAGVICTFFTSNMNLKFDYAFAIYDHDKNGILEYTEIVRFIQTCKCVTDIDDSDREETFNDMLTMAMDQLKISRKEGKRVEDFRKEAGDSSFFAALMAQCFPSVIGLRRMRDALSKTTEKEIEVKYRTMRKDLLCEWPDSKVIHYYPIPLDLP